jgi:hypothetical protein
MKAKPLQICNTTIQPGEQIALALPTPELYTCAPMHIPIHILHGKKEGPCLLVCAALHGDEVNGIAIIQKLLNYVQKKKIAGTLIAVPVVNIYGLMSQQRYLPDRRDLESNFPGSETGSYAARYAHFFTRQIFSKATHCIDLHTGEQHFQKHPQVITNFKRSEMLELAKVFKAPLMIDSETNFGFLWQMDEKEGIPTLIYQTGEAMRLDSVGISLGVRGIIKVMQYLGMIQAVTRESPHKPLMVDKTHWIRSPGSGLCRLFKKLGSRVKVDDEIASISDPFGTTQTFLIRSPFNGVIIEQNTLPLTNEGEPLVRIAAIAEKA